MQKKFSSHVLLIFFALIFITSPFQLYSNDALHTVFAVKDCRIVTLAGQPIEKGTVVIRDGLIEAVGASVVIPGDAEVIDGTGLTVYPGLTDGLGQSLIKMPEVKFDMTKIYTGEYTDDDKGLNQGFKAFDHFEVSKANLDKYHKFGITTAHVMPQKGIFVGQSSVFSLSESDKNAGVILKDYALGVQFAPTSFLLYPNSLMGVVALLRQEFSDAAYYKMHSSRWSKEMSGIPRPAYNARQKCLSDFATAKKPVVFHCRNQYDILRALDLAAELKLDIFICDTGNEAFRVIPELKKANARVFCPLDFKVPSTSLHAQLGKNERDRAEEEIYVKNPAKLAEAGIPFVFSSLGTDDPKSFIEGVQKTIENGLPREKALEALTVNAARFLGLDKALGTVEPGKMANLVVVEGEILSKDAKMKYVFADGKKFEIKEAKAIEGEKPAVNITGRWEFDVEGAGFKLTIDFVQEEASLSGKMSTPFGVFDFAGGSVAGNEIYFEMTIAVGGQEMDLYFSGTVEGDKMEGTVIQGTDVSVLFTAKRIPG